MVAARRGGFVFVGKTMSRTLLVSSSLHYTPVCEILDKLVILYVLARTSWRKVLKWSSQKVTKVLEDDERLFFFPLLKLRNGWWVSTGDWRLPRQLMSLVSRVPGAAPGCICKCRGGSPYWPGPRFHHPSETRQNTEHASPGIKYFIHKCVQIFYAPSAGLSSKRERKIFEACFWH